MSVTLELLATFESSPFSKLNLTKEVCFCNRNEWENFYFQNPFVKCLYFKSLHVFHNACMKLSLV